MTSRLALYNGALLALGLRKLTSLTENRAPRRRLDTVWDDGAVKFCLQQGLWNFAMQTVQLTYSPSVEPAFGFRFAFDKPTDWVRTFMMSGDETFACPLLEYEDQTSYWFANLDTLYARYVSDAAQYGGDFSLWPENFTRYVEHYLALRICKAETNSTTDKEDLTRDVKKYLNIARSTDAMDETTRFAPRGSWSTARNRWRNRRDGGSSGSLTG